MTYGGFACSFVLVQSIGRFPHFVTFTITVRFLVHSQILDIAKVTSIEVKVHGIRVGTVGALYQLGPNIGLVFILVIESTCLYT